MLTLVSKDVPTRHHRGEIPQTAHPAGAELLQHLYTSAHCVGNEQDELGGCDVVWIMKMWWLRHQGVAMEGQGGKMRQRVAPDVRELLGCTGLCLGMCEEPAGSSWF